MRLRRKNRDDQFKQGGQYTLHYSVVVFQVETRAVVKIVVGEYFSAGALVVHEIIRRILLCSSSSIDEPVATTSSSKIFFSSAEVMKMLRSISFLLLPLLRQALASATRDEVSHAARRVAPPASPVWDHHTGVLLRDAVVRTTSVDPPKHLHDQPPVRSDIDRWAIMEQARMLGHGAGAYVYINGQWYYMDPLKQDPSATCRCCATSFVPEVGGELSSVAILAECVAWSETMVQVRMSF